MNNKYQQTILLHLGSDEACCGGLITVLEPTPVNFAEYFCERCGFVVPDNEIGYKPALSKITQLKISHCKPIL